MIDVGASLSLVIRRLSHAVSGPAGDLKLHPGPSHPSPQTFSWGLRTLCRTMSHEGGLQRLPSLPEHSSRKGLFARLGRGTREESLRGGTQDPPPPKSRGWFGTGLSRAASLDPDTAASKAVVASHHSRTRSLEDAVAEQGAQGGDTVAINLQAAWQSKTGWLFTNGARAEALFSLAPRSTPSPPLCPLQSPRSQRRHIAVAGHSALS